MLNINSNNNNIKNVEKLFFLLVIIYYYLHIRESETRITFPYLISLHLAAHKALILFRHCVLSRSTTLASSQDFQPASALSFSTDRLQVVLGLPTFLLPSGDHVSAVTQWCCCAIVRTCPKNPPSLSSDFQTHPHNSHLLGQLIKILKMSSSAHKDIKNGQKMSTLLFRLWYRKESTFS